MAEKILPFDVDLDVSGREIKINASWKYKELAIKLDRTINFNLTVTQTVSGVLIFEYGDGSQFGEGVPIPNNLMIFLKNYISEFDNNAYLLSNDNFETMKTFSLQSGYAQLNISDFQNSVVETLAVGSQGALNGNLSDLPPTIKTYSDEGISEVKAYTGFTFSDGMTRFICLPIFSYFLTSGQLDQLLNDLAAVTWAGGGEINLSGFNAVRTSASDAAVTSLQGQGVTVTLNSAYNNFDYFMYNNQFPTLNTANELPISPGNNNFIDLFSGLGAPVVLPGDWFVEWIENNVASDPVIFGFDNNLMEIKTVGGGRVSVSCTNGTYTPVVFTHVNTANKLYRLSRQDNIFSLLEDGIEVERISIGTNNAAELLINLVGAQNPLPTPAVSTLTVPYFAFGSNGVYFHKYLFQSGTATLRDVVNGKDATINGTLSLSVGVATLLNAGTQVALTNWNKVGGNIVPESETNPGFDVDGNAILRFAAEGFYNFGGINGQDFRNAGVLNRTGAGTDLYLVQFEDFSVQRNIAGDDVYNHSIQTNGKFLVQYLAGGIESSGVFPAGKMFLFLFETDGVSRGTIFIADKDQDLQEDATGTIPATTPALVPMKYGDAGLAGNAFDGYLGRAAHFPRLLTSDEKRQVWNYYRRFFLT